MSERLTGSPKSQPNQAEIAEKFRGRLQAIWESPLTVENIERFGDEALSQLIEINDEILGYHQKQQEIQTPTMGKDYEDVVYEELNLPAVNEMLDLVAEVQEEIILLKEYIDSDVSFSPIVITPPDPLENPVISENKTIFEEKRLFSRLLTLLYILKHDFSITPSELATVEGSVRSNMMRKEPYVRVATEELKRIVYVCDEEGNASYIFNTDILDKLGIDTEQLDGMTKENRNQLITICPGAGVRLIQNPDWRNQVAYFLSNDLPTIEEAETKEISRPKVQPKSEFERKEFLPWEKFQTEVIKAWEEAGSPSGVRDWYRSEYKKQQGWPVKPDKKYKNQGWIGYKELVGLETKDFLTWDEFRQDVKRAYEKIGSPESTVKWYLVNKKNHHGWPSNPDKKYKNQGWIGWRELTGLETKDFLSWIEFQQEVIKAWEEARKPDGVQAWYQSEYGKHQNWPSVPGKKYKNQGWIGYKELVGLETKNLLPWNEFQQEVEENWETFGSPSEVYTWYKSEYSNHNNWPSNPNKKYRNQGWIGWREMVGLESKEFLPYVNFKKEAQQVWEEVGSPSGVRDWYQSEYKNHQGWPASPGKKYKNQGWIGWREFVGKK